MSEAEFRDRFRHSPLWRTKRRGLLRNAAIVLGNQRSSEAAPELVRACRTKSRWYVVPAPGRLARSTTTQRRLALGERFLIESDQPCARRSSGQLSHVPEPSIVRQINAGPA